MGENKRLVAEAEERSAIALAQSKYNEIITIYIELEENWGLVLTVQGQVQEDIMQQYIINDLDPESYFGDCGKVEICSYVT